MPYIAKNPGTAFRTFTDKDTFSGDGSTTIFDMQFSIAEAGQNDIQVFVAGAQKIPGTDFSLGVDATGEYKRITFTSAPASGTNNITILNPGTVQGEFSSVANNAITSGKLNADAISGQTELAEAAADDDAYLIYDDSASAIKKIKASNVTPNETLITGKTALGTGAAVGDQLLIYDISAGALKKITQQNLLNFPTVSSVSPTNLLSGDGTGNHTIVITGSGFTGGSAKLINASGSSINFASQTVNSDTQITGVVAKSNVPGSGEPYDVNVTAATGLASTLENQINVDQSPVFSNAAGSLGIFSDSGRTITPITVFASDPESGGDASYTIESGSLPAGLSGVSESSGFKISGTANAVGSDTTSTFTIRAKDAASNVSDRQFTIQILAPVSQSFTSSGTFSVPASVSSVNVLIVAGGGGGGGSAGGGGGAGGLVYRPGFAVTPGGTVSVTVGSGGAHGGYDQSQNAINKPSQTGQDSVFGTLTAKGGGGGSGGRGMVQPGSPGGSGGGARGSSNGQSQYGQQIQSTQPGDSGTYGFGSRGGDGRSGPGGYAGGGGGGSGAVGTDALINGSQCGQGGAGKAYNISGSSVTYSGGGGGSGESGASGGQGGSGGGGAGHPGGGGAGQNAQANTGGGGGGGSTQSSNADDGGNGGKGIVIVSY